MCLIQAKHSKFLAVLYYSFACPVCFGRHLKKRLFPKTLKFFERIIKRNNSTERRHYYKTKEIEHRTMKRKDLETRYRRYKGKILHRPCPCVDQAAPGYSCPSSFYPSSLLWGNQCFLKLCLLRILVQPLICVLGGRVEGISKLTLVIRGNSPIFMLLSKQGYSIKYYFRTQSY